MVLIRRRGWRGGIIGEVRDLSVGGAFIALPRDGLPPLSLLRLEWVLPSADGRDRVVHCNAMVVRAVRGGIGVAFDDLAPSALLPLWRSGQAAAPREAQSRL
jgi:hypothetical protein